MTVSHPLAGALRLLPCPELETLEQVRTASPQRRLSLSGQAYRYQEQYYFLIRKLSDAATVTTAPATMPAATQPTSQPAASQPTTKPSDDAQGASAGEVGQTLLNEVRPSAIIPIARDVEATPGGPSVAPPAEPLLPGPGRMIIRRLVRWQGPAYPGGWSRVAFESDNTLREPPLRVMPTGLLDSLERGSANSDYVGALFYISGDIYTYRGHNYVLLRSIRRQRDLDLF